MRIGHQVEQFILTKGTTSVFDICRKFRISEPRALEELFAISPFGIEISDEGRVSIRATNEQLKFN